MKKNVKKIFISGCLITVGCLLYSVGISMFLNPNALAPGGVSGIAIIVNQLTGLPTGFMIVLMNVPLLLAGCLVIGKGFLLKTVYAIAVSSFFIDLLPKEFPSLCPVTGDPMLAAIAGAVLSSIGIGLIFRCGGSTGGTDIVAKLLRRKFRNVRTGVIFMILDSLIVIASAIAFKNIENALFAGIALYLNGRVIDLILYGTDGAMLLIIISNKPELLAERLMRDVDAGVTYAEGSGAYTGEEKHIIICAVKKHHFYRAKDMVKREDPSAFMIVTGASEVFGQGYKPHGADEL